LPIRAETIVAAALAGDALSLAALAADCGDTLAPTACDTGMQLVASLRVPVSDRRVAAAAAALGVEVGAISSYGFGRSRRSGLVFGFGGVPPATMRSATGRLARAIEEARRPVALRFR
jgi:GntR family transcriptional regulator/MocR family aminotransferase